MLGSAVQQHAADGFAALLAFAQGRQRGQHGGLDALGGAAGEHQLAIAATQQAGSTLARLVQHRLRLQAGGMSAAGIAKPLAHHVGRGSDRGGQDRGGGVAVEVDFCVHDVAVQLMIYINRQLTHCS